MGTTQTIVLKIIFVSILICITICDGSNSSSSDVEVTPRDIEFDDVTTEGPASRDSLLDDAADDDADDDAGVIIGKSNDDQKKNEEAEEEEPSLVGIFSGNFLTCLF